MNCIGLIQKTIRDQLKLKCKYHHQKSVCTKSGVKLLIGVATVTPSLSTQKELKTPDKNDDILDKNDQLVVEESDSWKRLKAMYSFDEYGNYSKEVTATLQSTFFAGLMGFIYGGVVRSRVALRDFMERNQATIFENHIDAKRKLQNHVSIHFGKGAFQWGIKLSSFTGGFMLFLTSMAVYRGHSSMIDYIVSGTVVGGLIRLRLGPPAAVVGATLGGFLGFLSGVTTKGLFYLTGSNLDDVIAYQYEVDQNRYNVLKEIEKRDREKYMGKDELTLLKTHDHHNGDDAFPAVDSTK